MKLENDKFVSLVYTLHEGDKEGRVIETVEESAPLTFVFGAGRLAACLRGKPGRSGRWSGV
ncbi:MAG: hypothetical protein MZV63_22725 [Marinilabiliales bacterium]|nr:hypothetical protein [Marinilabiliales bacterium]